MKKTFVMIASLIAIVLSSCTAEYVGTRPAYDSDVAVGIAPGPGYVWVNREYVWRGGSYVAVPGYWARPSRPGRAWVAGGWYGYHGGYRWHRGYWR
jgi:hypothetical protein